MRPPRYEPHDTETPRPGGHRHVVVYDGECGMCRRWIRRLRRWDREGVLEYVPFQEEGVEERFPWIPPRAFREAVQVVAPDGRTWEGAGAAERLTHLLPGGRPLGCLFRVPLVRPVADRVYRWVAEHRGPAGGCALHGGPRDP